MVVMDYHTRDGLSDYGFSIEFQYNLGWRVYIVFQSPHHIEGEDVRSPYQAVDRDGRHYVNWAGKLGSLGEAKTVAALWAEIDQRYQRTQGADRNLNEADRNPSTDTVSRLRPDAA